MADLALDPTQLDRYSRQIIMDDIGTDGQRKLLDARVLIVGAGGLSSPVIQYLGAAGVGTLGIVDDDVVERSNLQRQVIHGDTDVGRSKVESAAEFVSQINPDINVEPHETRLDPSNAESLVADYDVVVDGSDNFETRYLVSDACTFTGRPLSHGAILRFEGQVATFGSEDSSPCYRCLFPEAPPAGTVPDCATAGVLGALPGTVGCIQATETLKLILDEGDSLDGRFLCYDAMALSFDEAEIHQQPDCPVCGVDPPVETVEDVTYSGRCAVSTE